MIKFSLIGPAVRSELYLRTYNRLNKNNSTSFELIFVGNNPPQEKMPDNFKYIFSESSPACCIEIAAREAKGEFLIITPDDCAYSDKFLDNMKKSLDDFGDKKMIIGARYKQDGIFNDECLTFDLKIKDSVPLPAQATYKRTDWLKLGGLDSRFDLSFCDADMIMRMYEIGYCLHIHKDVWIDEELIKNKKLRKIRMWKITGKSGRKLLNSLWVKDGKMSKTRLDKLHPFPEDIYNVKKWSR